MKKQTKKIAAGAAAAAAGIAANRQLYRLLRRRFAMHSVFAGGCYSAALGSVVYGPHAGCFFKRNH